MSEEKEEIKKEKEYEDICYICHRTESRAGKMIHIPNNICICNDCMQKTFDSMNNGGFGNMPYMDMMNFNPMMFGMGADASKLKPQRKEEKKAKESKSRRWKYANRTRYF